MSQARRTEKQWRHSDRELASAHALWSLLTGLHGAIAAVAGVLVGQASFSDDAFLWIGGLSLLSMALMVALNYLSRAADRRRAEYYEITSRPEDTWPQGFDEKAEDDKAKRPERFYRRLRTLFEVLVIVMFLVSAGILGYEVVYHD